MIFKSFLRDDVNDESLFLKYGSWSQTTAAEGVKQTNQAGLSPIFSQRFFDRNKNNFDEKYFFDENGNYYVHDGWGTS